MLQLASSRERERNAAIEQRQVAADAGKAAEDAKNTSLLVSAALAARSVASEIELRGSLLREEASAEHLKSLVSRLNENVDDEAAQRDLNSWIRDRYLEKESASPPTTSWSIYSRDGIQLARVAPKDGGDSKRSLFKSFRYRDYFHGKGTDFPKDSAEATSSVPHRQPVHVSTVYLSSNNNQLSVSFSVPIWASHQDSPDSQVIGIMSSSVLLSKLNLLPNTLMIDTRRAVILDEQHIGLVLRHPRDRQLAGNSSQILQGDESLCKDLLNLSGSATHNVNVPDNAFLISFQDPVTKTSSRGAAAPIHLRHNDDDMETGWRVIVLDSTQEASDQAADGQGK